MHRIHLIHEIFIFETIRIIFFLVKDHKSSNNIEQNFQIIPNREIRAFEGHKH